MGIIDIKDKILTFNLYSPNELMNLIAARLKEVRLSENLSQEGLAERAGISYGTLKRFERTGQISFESLLKIALVLGVLEDFDLLFKDSLKSNLSLDDIIQKPKLRQRGRMK